MITTQDEIIKNITKNGDFRGSSIDAKFAAEIVELLLKNTSIIHLNFTGSEIYDEAFQVIASGLITRNQKDLVLNIDNTKISGNSIDALKNLIDNKIVKTLLMYGIKGIAEETPDGIDLAKYAENKGVNISYDHSRDRASLGFFNKSTDENKDPSHNEFNIKEQEIKGLNDREQQHIFKK